MSNIIRNTFIVMIILVLILVIIVFIARSLFTREGNREAQDLLNAAALNQKEIVKPADLQDLPLCVQNWLRHSGVIGKPRIHSVRLTQTGRMRMEPDKPWMPVEAVQYINVDKPGFVWQANVKMMPFIFLQGKDRYANGHGRMQIKLLSLLPVVNAHASKEMDQGTMVRYLAEMMWYPTAALNDYIKWEEVDAHSARAVMNWQGVTASMVFNFDENGDMISNIAPRYQEVNGQFVLRDWGGISRSFREFDGIRIANKSDVVWKYETGDFNWLQIEVTDIDYNPAGLY